MHGAHPDIFLRLPKTFSSLDPFYQGHMQLLPNTTSQRHLTFLQFTCSPGSEHETAPIDLSEGECELGKKQRADKEEEKEEHRKSLTSVLCVLGVATAVSGSAKHKSHQGELSGTAGKTQQRKRSLSAQKHGCKTSFCTAFVVSSSGK